MADRNEAYIDTGLETKNLELDISKVIKMLQNMATKCVSIVQKMGSAIVSKIDNDLKQTKGYVGILGAIYQAFYRMGNSAIVAFKLMGDGLKNFGKSVLSPTKNIQRLGNVIKSSFSLFSKFAKKILPNFNKKLNGVSLGFGGGFKNVLKYAFGIRSLFVLFNRLRSALVEGFKNLAQFNDGVNPTNEALSKLKSALTQLKNSFATAFAPVLTMIEPILTRLINLISELATKIGMLFASLSGASTFTKAIKVQEDYAKSLNNTSKSAKKAKTILSGLDEINVISKDDNDTGSVSPNQMFETVPVEQMTMNFSDKIVEALSNIPWDSIRQKAENLGKNIADLLNNIINTPQLGSTLGTSIAQAFNTAFDFAYGFVSNFNWSEFGTLISDAINSFVDKFDWGKAGKTLSDLAIGLLDAFINAVEKIDWQKVGESLATMLANIDWNTVISRLFEAIGAVLGALAGFLWGLIKDAWENVKQWWYDTAYEDGKFTMSGLLKGIKDKLVNIGKWIKENIFQPFIDGFKKAFGIHSPSTVMAEQGGFIMQGLYNGISGMINKIVKLFTNIKDKIIEVFNILKKDLVNVINGIINSIEKMANSVVQGINTVIQALNTLAFDIPDWVPALGGKSFGFNIKTLGEVSIPRLATGTVVPRQASEFMAILGDNNKETEVVSPLSTMKQAFMESLMDSEFISYLAQIANNTRETANKDTSVYIGDRDIARANIRGTRMLGAGIRTI